MPNAGTKEASATLSAHSGAVKISRQELALIKTPERTTSFTPVPHGHLVDVIESELDTFNMKIQSAEFAVMSDGMKLFGTLVLSHQTRDDFNFALGLRTSNDKTMAAQLVAGFHVFVCDNMAMSGELITWRKHTGLLDIRAELHEGIGKAISRFSVLGARVDTLKGTGVSDVEAKAFMLDAALKGVMPLRLLPDVNKAYFEPPHVEFESRTMWSLHNAFTEAFKDLRPNVAQESVIELGKMFAM